MSILLAGGAGYIGSHTAVELIRAGYDVVIADNFDNSSPEVLRRIEQITGVRPKMYRTDVKNPDTLKTVFTENSIDVVIHFAGLKAVGESVEKPVKYYRNNIDTTLTLLEVMQETGCRRMVFSSSATIYGEEAPVPYTEDMGRGKCTNPYGWTKWMIEQILTDLHTADPEWDVVLLRYFNPIGAHESGLIGEDPKGIPNNLVPYVAQVAIGKMKAVRVFGNDYPTPDGTGVRDYIHVVDLARGHVAALNWMDGKTGVEVVNLGTGKGSSVLDVVAAFSRACGRELPVDIQPRRAGDVAENYADPQKAKDVFGWVAEYDLDRMCADSWRWQSMNPNGYAD